jgi:heptose I phosphotransferase
MIRVIRGLQMGDTFWQRLLHGTRRLRPSGEWERFAGPAWADQIMVRAATDRHHAKQGRSIGRLILESGGDRLVVYLKRHYRLPWWQGLLALIRPSVACSPALQEWDHLAWARSEGFPVPDTMAGGEFIGPWGKLQSFLAVKELSGMLPLHEAVPAAKQALAPAEFRRWKKGLVEEMARLSAALHQRRRFHKDLYLCHFYIAADDTTCLPKWRGRVWMIDLHRLAHHPISWPLALAKDLAQLWYSSEIDGVDARDRLAFWRAYRKLNPGADTAWLRWFIDWKVWNYRRHSRRGGKKSLVSLAKN